MPLNLELDTTCCPKLKWTNGSIGTSAGICWRTKQQRLEVGSKGCFPWIFVGCFSLAKKRCLPLKQLHRCFFSTPKFLAPTLHARATQRSAVFPGRLKEAPFWEVPFLSSPKGWAVFFFAFTQSGEAWPSLKMDAWNTILSFWNSLFSGALAVSFRESFFLWFCVFLFLWPRNTYFFSHEFLDAQGLKALQKFPSQSETFWSQKLIAKT